MRPPPSPSPALPASQINLVSASPGSQWTISPSANFQRHLGLRPGQRHRQQQQHRRHRKLHDGGNNKTSGPGGDWQFSAGTTLTWDGSSSSDWRVGANWDLNRVPGVSDNATIPVGAPNNPSLTAAATVVNLTVTTGTLSLEGWNLDSHRHSASRCGRAGRKVAIAGRRNSYDGTRQIQRHGGVLRNGRTLHRAGGGH